MMQRVLMTAGASGIGKEIARAFVAKGARVCVCDIDVTAMETAVKDIASKYNVRCQWEGVPDEAFMILVKEERAIPAEGGVVRYREEFIEAI